MALSIPSKYKTALEKIQAAGFEVYLVGGCVRDHLLGLPIKDYDFVTTATPEQGKMIFPEAIQLAQKFGVLRVPMGSGEFLDLATARKDGPYSDGRHPDFVEYSSVIEDLSRRDFTINALLYDPIKEELVDMVGGLEDLKVGILRTVGKAEDRFQEDPLRMWRGVRFQVKLGFPMATDAIEAIRKNSALALTPSKERITEELKQALSMDSAKTLTLLREYGLDFLFFKQDTPPLIDEEMSFYQSLLYLSQQEGDLEYFCRKILVLGSDDFKTLKRMREQYEGLKKFSALSLEEKNRLKFSYGIEEVVEFYRWETKQPLDFNYLSKLERSKLSELMPKASDFMDRGLVGKAISQGIKDLEKAVYSETVTTTEERLQWLSKYKA